MCIPQPAEQGRGVGVSADGLVFFPLRVPGSDSSLKILLQALSPAELFCGREGSLLGDLMGNIRGEELQAVDLNQSTTSISAEKKRCLDQSEPFLCQPCLSAPITGIGAYTWTNHGLVS